MALLHLQNVSFTYPQSETAALRGVNLDVEAGEFVLLCGESGCGKSTLLRLIKRELSPFGDEDGEIAYAGAPVGTLDARRATAEIGFVLQDPEAQIVTDTVWHELAFGLESLGLESTVIRRRVAEMASYFGLEDWMHKPTAALSGGQKQLLNLASVMAMNPKLLLLDEPTAQLDPIAAANFIGTLQKLNRELGLTILLIEHRLEEVFPIVDRVVLMADGAVAFDGEPRQSDAFFKAHPSHPMEAGLPSAMRIFRLLGGEGDSPLTVREGRRYLERYAHTAPPLRDEPPHGEAAVQLQNVWFRYEKTAADILKGCDLTVYRGEHFCILGGNGAGKSTTLKVIAGLCRPHRGKVRLFEQRTALLPQDPRTVFLGKTVREDLAEIQADETQIASVCELLGITHTLERHPYDLSGGEQQRAALAKLLLLRPQVLLLDEPTKGIDAYAKRTLAAILQTLKADGVTVITVTHDVEFAAMTGDRLGLFFDGELTAAETPTVFFAENNFYTTAANRIARGIVPNAILCEQVARACAERAVSV